MSANMDLDHLYETFEFLDDWEERYRVIIDLGRKLPEMPEEQKTEETKVRGCMSQVWMITKKIDDAPPRYEFIADSDSHIVKGLIGVLQLAYSGKTLDEIREVKIEDIFARLGLDSHLSPNRRNGFFSMVERINLLASAN
ncbi:MAG: SufE family protein [Candidatus Hinthialibacter antarcticus]|nr:SufE family protein [Candidatus Hinthialibacter antarcticus]